MITGSFIVFCFVLSRVLGPHPASKAYSLLLAQELFLAITLVAGTKLKSGACKTSALLLYCLSLLPHSLENFI